MRESTGATTGRGRLSDLEPLEHDADVRFRVFGYVILASASAFGLMTLAQALVDRRASENLPNQIADRAVLGTGTA